MYFEVSFIFFPDIYLQLIDTRGSQKNYTLLNLLVDMLSVKEQETLTLGQDLSSAKYAAEGINSTFFTILYFFLFISIPTP